MPLVMFWPANLWKEKGVPNMALLGKRFSQAIYGDWGFFVYKLQYSFICHGFIIIIILLLFSSFLLNVAKVIKWSWTHLWRNYWILLTVYSFVRRQCTLRHSSSYMTLRCCCTWRNHCRGLFLVNTHPHLRMNKEQLISPGIYWMLRNIPLCF